MTTDEAVERLAGGIAHDFDALLDVIVGHADTLSDCLSPGDPRTAQVVAIRRAAEQAATLTQQLLAFSRTQAHEPAILNLNTLVHAARPMLQRLLGAGVRLEVTLAPDLACVHADSVQLEHILRHLAANARDAMPGGGRLTLATANVSLDTVAAAQREVPPGEYVELSATDTGIGIAEALQPRLFEPFFTTKARERGTGLGLAMVHGVVSQSRGHISVESAVGEGARFAIYLPATSDRRASVSPEVGGRAKADRGSETVLLMGEDPGVRAFIGDALTRRGYRVLVAVDEADALRLVAAEGGAIDLLMTAGRDGAGATETLRRCLPAVRELDVPMGKPLTPDGLARRVRASLNR